MNPKAFLLTKPGRKEKLFREFPELSRLKVRLVKDFKDLLEVYEETLRESIAVVFPYPLRPYFEPEYLSKQAAFAMLCDRCLFLSPYPRPQRLLRLAREPMLIGDLLVFPSRLRRIVNRI